MIYITVCKNRVLSNLKHGEHKPPLRVCVGKYGKPKYKHTCKVPKGRAVRVIYDPTHPLPWGARAWIEVL